MAKNNTLPTETQVEEFRMLDQLLDSIYFEMKEFSKKKPDEPLNKFKVKNVNRVLEPIKNILILEPTNMFLDIMDEDSLPTNSDAILVIGQFKASMMRFQKKYKGSYNWETKENPTGAHK
jgi:hypothetical protein